MVRTACMLALASTIAACGAATSETTFASTYGERYCEATEACGSSLECSPVVGERAGCAYDAEAAAACLDGVWTCNTDYQGYEFAQPPSACDRVWDCQVASK
jgi:hypothetical protein